MTGVQTCALPILTGLAYDGIDDSEICRPKIANTADGFAKACLEELQRDNITQGSRDARNHIKSHYDWGSNISKVATFLQKA